MSLVLVYVTIESEPQNARRRMQVTSAVDGGGLRKTVAQNGV